VTRILCPLAFVLALVAVRPAFADPTPAQLEAAKKAFVEGKALHDQGKLNDAVEKFKESYKLSKNSLLLYNIGFTLDELKNAGLALVYYRRFLSDAPKDATQRAEVTERVKVLEKEISEIDLDTQAGSAAAPPPETTKPTTPGKVEAPSETGEPKGPFKPAGTYKAEDVIHQVVAEAPPGKPLDLSASIPLDSGFSIVLYYRGANESNYTARPMHWRLRELVGRIPAAKMAGGSMSYYLEVKDQTGNVVTRSGKSTEPNLVDIEASAPPRYYQETRDEPAPTTPTKGTDENPLGGNGSGNSEQPGTPEGPQPTGWLEVGSKKFTITKWSATGATVALFAVSIVFAAQAADQANQLKLDAGQSTQTGQPCVEPCHSFDGYDANLQSVGQRDQTLSRVAFGVGVVGLGVAGYYWYRQLFGSHAAAKTEPNAPNAPQPAHDELGWIIVPAAGDGFTGAAAAVRF
jgi:hypothetical protein